MILPVVTRPDIEEVIHELAQVRDLSRDDRAGVHLTFVRRGEPVQDADGGGYGG